MDLNFWKKEFPKKVTKTCKVAGEKSSQLIIYSDETFASTSQLVLGYQAIIAVYM